MSAGRLLNCSLEPFQKLLGDKKPSIHQLKLCLQLIGDKINEHIYTVCYYERMQKKKDKSSSSRLKKYIVHPPNPTPWIAAPISLLVPASPCPACIETRWMSRVSEGPEAPFDAASARSALTALASERAFLRSDRVHALAECRAALSRRLLAQRYLR